MCQLYFIESALRMVVDQTEGDRVTIQKAGGSRELRLAVGLTPYVGHRRDLTGGEGVSAQALEGVQLVVTALQLGHSLAHRSHGTSVDCTDAPGRETGASVQVNSSVPPRLPRAPWGAATMSVLEETDPCRHRHQATLGLPERQLSVIRGRLR